MISLFAFALMQAPALKLNPLISDGMVLQRNAVDPIWGTARPGAFVQVSLNGQTVGARADGSGNWRTDLTHLAAGFPFQMTITSGLESVTLNDVAVGEVWLASGQSNMGFTESEADDYALAQATAKPDIRMFTVKPVTSDHPVLAVDGSWEVASADTVGHFSAVGLAFARELEQRLHVPVGIIHSSWGGTPAEAWTSKEALEREPATKALIDTYEADLNDFPTKRAAYDTAMQLWIDGKTGGVNQGFLNGWATAEFNDSDWQTVPAGTRVETVMGREFDGAFWYRKTFDLPDEWFGKTLRLELGALDDFDSTYVNGVRVGRTDQTSPNSWSVQRSYLVAPGILRRGTNTIAIRVFNASGPGGMFGPLENMRVGLPMGATPISLNSDWKFKIEQELDPKAPRPQLPWGPGDPYAPTQLFNAMISPLIPYRIKGAIWYQGEANVGRAAQYSKLFPTMIRDWRSRWGNGYFPFYFVQLANYMQRKDQPGDSDWAELREAQGSALKMPQTGEAIIIDIGDANDIHPKNKKEVGRRLSLIALSRSYGQPIYYASPRCSSVRYEGSNAIVAFDNGSLMTDDGQAPKGFALAGSDGVFHWAQARIDGSNVILNCSDVAEPKAVRYAWADNPDVNLINHAYLPACPFRTDGPK